jgi:predicted chitinase
VDKERYRRVGFIRLTGPSGLTMFRAKKTQQIILV